MPPTVKTFGCLKAAKIGIRGKVTEIGYSVDSGQNLGFAFSYMLILS